MIDMPVCEHFKVCSDIERCYTCKHFGIDCEGHPVDDCKRYEPFRDCLLCDYYNPIEQICELKGKKIIR